MAACQDLFGQEDEFAACQDLFGQDAGFVQDEMAACQDVFGHDEETKPIMPMKGPTTKTKRKQLIDGLLFNIFDPKVLTIIEKKSSASEEDA